MKPSLWRYWCAIQLEASRSFRAAQLGQFQHPMLFQQGMPQHPGFDKQGTRFKRLITDRNDHKEVEEGINRFVLCSRKVYYELDEERKKTERNDVAICRVEQLCTFPYDLIQREQKRYPNAEIVWCQEEPMNMGAYSYISPRLYSAMSLGRGSFEDVKYASRAPSAATATGFLMVHVQEQSELVKKALQPEPA